MCYSPSTGQYLALIKLLFALADRVGKIVLALSKLSLTTCDKPLAIGSRNWTQMIQRLVARSGIDKGLKKGEVPTNWYSIRRTFADWLDE